MSNRFIIFLKVCVHVACLAPITWLVIQFWRASTTAPDALGPDPIAAVTFFTGKGTLRLLVLTLAITPVRRLISKLGWTIRFRRMLGLYAFFYACLHLLTYVWLYSNFSLSAMVSDISQRRFITAGLTAWLLMLPLALTSTAWAIRKLGGKRWRALHSLVYFAAIAGTVHYWWGVKTGVKTPLKITIVLATLLFSRIVFRLITPKYKPKPQMRQPAQL
ncbi:sulfite oxidase heme-binding subunit YedZ [Pseudacidobacterium ailaaui]|jgi:sulfoxide reductase heme-binding subunit YedZ|uniref:sulfite oxidase heme-binding subunit YedZ n=1 Tax=Pseudacidobacterium ailaaui TaxID=1382359 RepID=UPI00047B7009|nr:protein-methionine-sulfoxide reductase heme-binding subunit MsrQ [Pseudacidobacterium ailaaui]MBX6358724.1 sulfoxide reductase heme-binding subunit YedZ [Pseudacidobacterium ailaaui]MDI3253991.1 protein-methionine-sulfoxide reductase heme-binding subunit MsrQ [Bacillota bacterium]